MLPLTTQAVKDIQDLNSYCIDHSDKPEMSDENLHPKDSEILPHIRVTKFKWSKWNIKYVIVFLQDRLLFAKVGTEWDDPDLWQELGKAAGRGIRISGSALGGMITKDGLETAGGIIGARHRKITEDTLAMTSELPTEAIVGLDENNFEILYSDISSVKIRKDRIFSDFRDRIGAFEIKGKMNDKFDIESDENYANCVSVVKSFLSDKMV
jgi:hypothetical protein